MFLYLARLLSRIVGIRGVAGSYDRLGADLSGLVSLQSFHGFFEFHPAEDHFLN